MDISMHPIAHIRSDFPAKFGIPRQSGLVEALRAQIIFTPEYRDAQALRGIEGFSHLWLLWCFSESVGKPWTPTVRPPRLGGNTRLGVFATRSPFRPNPIALSCVRLERVDGCSLIVSGADLMDGTPIFDIKPYIPYADAHPEAASGFTANAPDYLLQVNCPDALLVQLPPDRRAALLGVLAHDPRPSYQHDPQRIYGMAFAGWQIRFTVEHDVLTVREIVKEPL